MATVRECPVGFQLRCKVALSPHWRSLAPDRTASRQQSTVSSGSGKAVHEGLDIGAPIQVPSYAFRQRYSIDQACLHPFAEGWQAHRAELGGHRLRNQKALMKRYFVLAAEVVCFLTPRPDRG